MSVTCRALTAVGSFDARSQTSELRWIRFGAIVGAALTSSFSIGQIDLVAGGFSVNADATATTVTLTYLVDAPTDVNQYSITFGLDRDGDGDIEETLRTLGGAPTPGLHTLTEDLRPQLNALGLRTGDALVVQLDPQNSVSETSEANNGGRWPFIIDLELNAFTLEPSATALNATFVYTVRSPASVRSTDVAIALDRDNNGIYESTISLGGLDPLPGVHMLVRDVRTLLTNIDRNTPIQAVIDRAAQVMEQSESNNSINRTLTIDLEATALAVEAGPLSTTARFSYYVNSLTDMASFGIRFGVDTNNDGTPERFLTSLAGDRRPGPHVLMADVRSDAVGVNNGDRVIAQLDFENRMIEVSEANNVAPSGALLVDLIANDLSIDARPMVHFAYTVDSPSRVNAFLIRFYLDTGDGMGGPPDGILQRVGASPDQLVRTQSGISVPISTRIAFPLQPVPEVGQTLFAVVDADSAVGEASEGNNVLSFVRPPLLCGDLDCDGVVSNFDVDAFLLALIDPDAYRGVYVGCCPELADMNGDGSVDNFDVDGFVRALQG